MADKKPLTDEQQDLLMDYLLDKFMREKEFDQMRKEDRYNQPPKTDAVGKEIVSANMGGMISMDQMTAPLMMAEGGSPNQKLLDQIAKGGKNVSKMKVPTTRLDNNYRNTLLESGFEKKADSKDVKRGDAKKVGQKIGSFNSFNNYLKGKGLTLFSNDPRTMIKVTTELNKVRAGLNLPKYTNVGITTPRSLFEQKQTGTGYAERGSRIPKEKVEKVRLQAQLEADKKFGVTEKPTQKKLRFMAKFIQGKLGKKVTMASIMTMLTKSGFGKVLPGMSLLMPSEVEAATMYPEGVNPVKEIEMQEAQKRMNMNQGGIMDINQLTRKLR